MFFANKKSDYTLFSEKSISYRSFGLHNLKNIPLLENLTSEEIFDIKVVGTVLPFKVNNYIIENLINWNNIPKDPIFQLTFPQKKMLNQQHYNIIANAIETGKPKSEIIEIANQIRRELNPHPAGQLNDNVPEYKGRKLNGIQHKYNETVLFFPKQGQTCHAYCTFCFRWPQFTHLDDVKISSNEIHELIKYIEVHPEVTDLLITGGDPMIMSGKIFSNYINQILYANIKHLHTIRIGSKSLSYWPYRFVTDRDSDLILRTFEKVVKSGRQLSFIAHFSHYNELRTEIVKKAISRILSTGAVIRTQSPVLRYVNDDPMVWEIMWKEQVKLGMVPYYMFIPRDTGAKEYFKISLTDAYQIFRDAFMNVGGNARTVRGPVMSCYPGKIQILGISRILNEDVLVLTFIQGRNPEWTNKPFLAEINFDAYWIDDLKPAFGEQNFFFENKFRPNYYIDQLMVSLFD
jgi:KamA family protein